MEAKAWRLRREIPAGPAPWRALGEAWDLDPRAARLAWLRGADRPEDLAWRLDASWGRTTDPHLLPGVDAAVARIRRAVEARERIVIYGDYDVDGVTATALLVRALEKLGADVSFFIPNRFSDGYGLHLDCIRELKETRDPALLVSVDCGGRSAEDVRASAELGMDWVITDHHALGAELPPACAVVHPHLDGYANPFLAGVGVAFKLAQALIGAAPHPSGADAAFLDGLLKLVAIGTVADVMPLAGENALLVRRGLDALAGKNGPGLAALLRAAKKEGALGGQDIAFGLAPRLNAVGRMGGAEDAVRLLLTRDAAEAETLMARVEALNSERRAIQQELAARLPAPEGAFDLALDPTAHKGVIGIVAGQRMRASGRPAGVCTVIDGVAHGSLRAPDGYDLAELLALAQPFILGGGGHRAAAGLSFEASRFPFVRQALQRGAETQGEGRGRSALAVDGGPGDLPDGTNLARLEPFGQGFAPPLARIDGPLASVSAFGADHWKLRVAGLADPLTWFAGSDRPAQPVSGERISLAAGPQDSARWGRSWIVDAPLEAGEAVP
ncbi:DHH family phosphoesterase [Geothrix sp. 21YS21S-4]|uniref:single-stranded-DNA-specific exonuclease RecJ n=1 Tax=Geothrix sp. 21YS21S-4 TaxID=3068889 RepID=UPI0027BA7A65|nr:DHH family phosphoesterase [Geothrix sp. 21YS21S-4]